MTRVCVIEDDHAIRESVRLLLEDEGYEVLEATDGVAGLAHLQESLTPLVVLLDHKLPAMNGCELLHQVEHDPALQRHAYVYMTAARDGQVRDECGDVFERVGVDLVAKPFNLDELLDAVESAARNVAVGTPNAFYSNGN